MKNAQFASYLQKASEAKKINNTKFTQEFIDSHLDYSISPSIPEESTDEIRAYAQTFISKKAKSTDSEFTILMQKWATETPTEKVVEVSAPKTYRGEY